MHELAVCEGLVKEVNRVARAASADRVLSVTIRIGPLCGVDPELLRCAYPLAVANTAAADSRLIVERAAVRVHCDQCNFDSETSSTRLVCGHCANSSVRVLSGDQLLLVRLELMRECDA